MKKRINNIFSRDQKTFIMAMDHGTVMDIGQSFHDPASIIDAALEGGIDAILTTTGIASQYAHIMGNTGLILRIDGGMTVKHPDGRLFGDTFGSFSVRESVRLGADGVICMLYSNLPDQVGQLDRISKIYSECKDYGISLCIETLPGGFTNEEYQTVDNIGFACRLACEFGADFVKAPYTATMSEYRQRVVMPCYKPLIILGGGNVKTDRDLLETTKDAMDAGCKGVAYGRTIWGHSNVKGICKALNGIIHNGMSVDEAMKYLT